MESTLCNLPTDVLNELAHYLPPLELLHLGRLCHKLYASCSQEEIWKKYCARIFAVRESEEITYKGLFATYMPNVVIVDPSRTPSQPKKPTGASQFLRAIFKKKKSSPEPCDVDLCNAPVFTSLPRALSNAKPKNPVFLIYPGVHSETSKDGYPLVVDRECHIVAATHDPTQEPVTMRVPIRFSRGRQVIRNINFDCHVEIASTATLLSSCKLCCGVEVRAGVGHRLVGCSVSEARGYGITFHDGSGGVVEHCDIFNNHTSGLEIATRNAVSVLNCNIHHNGNGVIVAAKGECLLQFNNIYSNNAPGVILKQDATATVLNNRLHDGNWGIVLKENAHAIVSYNECYQNRHSAICLQTTANPLISFNHIHDERRGIVVTGKVDNRRTVDDEAALPLPMAQPVGRPVIEENMLERSSRSAISVKNCGNPLIVRNKIANGRWGIVIQKGGAGTIRENEIYDNTRPGIGIKTQANPYIVANIIRDGKAMGLLCAEGGRGHIEGNIFRHNRHSAITIKSHANPVVVRNEIHNERRGVDVSDRGSGVIQENDIHRVSKSGITVRSSASPTIQGNIVYKGRHGIAVHANAKALVQNNTLFENEHGNNIGTAMGGVSRGDSPTSGNLATQSPTTVAPAAATAASVMAPQQSPNSSSPESPNLPPVLGFPHSPPVVNPGDTERRARSQQLRPRADDSDSDSDDDDL
eukprot:TRINITY_DN4790_c0_g1_i1.p1 TRINITY_DN4790_c0_g1~~TRINITY_DN4790_c0_g1_i1.p1  ORF type:complete len:697 (+),score=83.11 TRINITY_DN4790_c0_g1_i1:40-2130(+)